MTTSPLPMPRRARVLVVDDEPFSIRLLYQVLRQEHDVFMAVSGPEAIRFCLADPPDLVLLDVSMPDMDGLETCRQLKDAPATTAIPVIFVTAGHHVDDENACWLAGGVDFVTKPVAPLTLCNRVRAHLQIKFHADALRAQRDDILSTLAHEVQQPLGHASAALENAIALVAQQAASAPTVLKRLQQAGSVVHGVVAAIDNTLANSVLLAQREPLALHDEDIDLLLDLACTDIDPQQRWRIARTRSTTTRTARMHAGLMRLALRNVIANALAYSPPDSQVLVNVAESERPLALLFEVSDLGPGLAPGQLPALLARGARGGDANQPAGHGLGLYIVGRVMQMHGGDITSKDNVPHGLVLQLALPQGGPD